MEGFFIYFLFKLQNVRNIAADAAPGFQVLYFMLEVFTLFQASIEIPSAEERKKDHLKSCILHYYAYFRGHFLGRRRFKQDAVCSAKCLKNNFVERKK